MSEIQKIIKEWRDFSTAQLHENGMLTEQLEFTVRVAQEWQSRAEEAERRVVELEVILQKWRKFVGFDHPSWDKAFTPDNDWSQYLTAKSIETNPRETVITYFDGTREIISYSESRKEE